MGSDLDQFCITEGCDNPAGCPPFDEVAIYDEHPDICCDCFDDFEEDA